MRFPRLPWGPKIPPAGSEEDRKFILRGLIAFGLICFIVGIIYATGIGQNNRALGIALIVLSVGFIYPYWLVARRSGEVHPTDENRRDPFA